MDENNVVQAEPVSEVEPVSTEETPKEEPKEEPKEQPFNEEQEARIQQLVSQASTVAKEEGRREMQGIKDREVAAADRRTKEAENAFKSSLDNLDPEVQKDVELARYRSREKDEGQREQSDTYFKKLQDSLVESIEAMGIDKNDKGIDWATDEADFIAGRSRFDASVVKILKGKESEKDKVLDDKLKKFETDFRKKYELDNVDTSTSPSVSGTDQDFVDKMTIGALPMTKENEERFNKIRNK